MSGTLELSINKGWASSAGATKSKAFEVSGDEVARAFASIQNYRFHRQDQAKPIAKGAVAEMPGVGQSIGVVPYPHFSIPDFLPSSLADRLLTWLEAQSDWNLFQVENFYSVYNFDVLSREIPSDLGLLTSDQALAQLRAIMSENFGCRIDETRVNIEAQKMVAGQCIGIHSDFGGANRKACRLLIHLNRGWDVSQGGVYMLLGEEHAEHISSRDRFYLPQHNCAFGFLISENSYHAVSEVEAGERFSIVYSFYPSAEAG